MDDILKQLRSAAGYQHDDLSVCGEAADRIEALEAENARLREALEPFAELPLPPSLAEQELAFGPDIKRARAALATPPPLETPAQETVQPYTRAALTARIMADHGGEPKPKPGYGRKW